MKAISVKQPWAHRIYEDIKHIETRTWSTDYRGDLLIVSSRKPDENLLDDVTEEMLFGKALCIARLVDCRPMKPSDRGEAWCEVYPGAYAWVLEDIRPVRPFEVKGQLGLYEVNDSLIVTDCENCNGTQGGCDVNGNCIKR